jgi:NAD-dependent deacetylase
MTEEIQKPTTPTEETTPTQETTPTEGTPQTQETAPKVAPPINKGGPPPEGMVLPKPKPEERPEPGKLVFPERLLERLRTAEHVMVLTGAGASAESGVPTFRDAQKGLWSEYDPQELATPQAFEKDPKKVWEWYAWRRKLVSEAQPNPAHYALVEIEQRVPKFTLVTQNVDGLHQRAGSVNVLEFHGNLFRVKRATDGVIVDDWNEDGELPPRCPETGSLLRPDVVWFGEELPQKNVEEALRISEICDVFFYIGSSDRVYPAAWLPMNAIESGAAFIVINTETNATTFFPDWFYFRGKAGEVLPAMVRAAWPTDESQAESAGEATAQAAPEPQQEATDTAKHQE